MIKLWQLLDYLCGKRLLAILRELIAKLERFVELDKHRKELFRLATGFAQKVQVAQRLRRRM